MESAELRRLIVRHRDVTPLLSALLANTNARVRITDLAGDVILDRQAGDAPAEAAPAGDAPAGDAPAGDAPAGDAPAGDAPAGDAPAGDAPAGVPVERCPITLDGTPVSWVEGPRPAGAIAAVISYAAAREADKSALANEALDCYRELNLLYDLAEQIGATLEVDAVARVAVGEASRLQPGSEGFLFLREGTGALRARPAGDPTPLAGDDASGGLLGAIILGDAEVVNDVAGDPRANVADKAVSSLVAAPLRVRGQPIGVVGTASVAPVEYRVGDLKLIIALATLVGPAIQQAMAREAGVVERPAGGS